MEDIGKAPDYGGPLVLVILRMIIGALIIALAFQKIQWIGDSGIINQVSGILSGVITLGVVIGVFLLIAFWLGKSFIVKHACDNGSSWTFQTAASVAGYAYIRPHLRNNRTDSGLRVDSADNLQRLQHGSNKTSPRRLSGPSTVNQTSVLNPRQFHSFAVEILPRSLGHKMRHPQKSISEPRLPCVLHSGPARMANFLPNHQHYLN